MCIRKDAHLFFELGPNRPLQEQEGGVKSEESPHSNPDEPILGRSDSSCLSNQWWGLSLLGSVFLPGGFTIRIRYCHLPIEPAVTASWRPHRTNNRICRAAHLYDLAE